MWVTQGYSVFGTNVINVSLFSIVSSDCDNGSIKLNDYLQCEKDVFNNN